MIVWDKLTIANSAGAFNLTPIDAATLYLDKTLNLPTLTGNSVNVNYLSTKYTASVGSLLIGTNSAASMSESDLSITNIHSINGYIANVNTANAHATEIFATNITASGIITNGKVSISNQNMTISDSTHTLTISAIGVNGGTVDSDLAGELMHRVYRGATPIYYMDTTTNTWLPAQNENHQQGTMYIYMIPINQSLRQCYFQTQTDPIWGEDCHFAFRLPNVIRGSWELIAPTVTGFTDSLGGTRVLFGIDPNLQGYTLGEVSGTCIHIVHDGGDQFQGSVQGSFLLRWKNLTYPTWPSSTAAFDAVYN